MAILNFSDVLKNVGLDPKRVKLIRHSLGDKAFKKCYDKNMVEEYTRVQSETFSNGYDYWCVFISDKSTTAKFFACYKVNGGVIDTQDTKPKGFPLEDWFQGQRMFYNLERIDLLKEYEGRLLIECGLPHLKRQKSKEVCVLTAHTSFVSNPCPATAILFVS